MKNTFVSSSNIPKAEGLTAVEAWVIVCVLFVFGALIEYAGKKGISRNKSEHLPIPFSCTGLLLKMKLVVTKAIKPKKIKISKDRLAKRQDEKRMANHINQVIKMVHCLISDVVRAIFFPFAKNFFMVYILKAKFQLDNH